MIKDILGMGFIIIGSFFILFMWVYTLVITLNEMYPKKKKEDEPKMVWFDPRKYSQ